VDARRELVPQLQAHGHAGLSPGATDTELILRAYQTRSGSIRISPPACTCASAGKIQSSRRHNVHIPCALRLTGHSTVHSGNICSASMTRKQWALPPNSGTRL
jgi:hypothetical protein